MHTAQIEGMQVCALPSQVHPRAGTRPPPPALRAPILAVHDRSYASGLPPGGPLYVEGADPLPAKIVRPASSHAPLLLGAANACLRVTVIDRRSPSDRPCNGHGLLIRRFLCGYPGPFISVRDLRHVLSRWSCQSEAPEGCSSVRLPTWLPISDGLASRFARRRLSVSGWTSAKWPWIVRVSCTVPGRCRLPFGRC